MYKNLLDFLDYGAGVEKYRNKKWIDDDELSWTFAEFVLYSKIIATNLLGKVRQGQPVAVLLPNSAWMLACDFGILRCGCAYMNLDAALPMARLLPLLRHVCPTLIIAENSAANFLAEQGFENVISFPDLILPVEIEESTLSIIRERSIDTDPACLITTSGSTGVPKAVALTHRGLIDFGTWFDGNFPFSDQDIVGSLSPLFFDGYFPGLLMSLLHGGQFHIIPRSLASFPIRLAEHLKEKEITFIFWVPSTLIPLATFDILRRLELFKLRFIGFAGEVMPARALAYLRRYLPHAKLVNFYGPVEISVICTSYVIPDSFSETEPVPIGYACTNTDIIILDENNCPVPADTEGELCVRGTSLALGYWNDAERTAKAFVINPVNNAYPEKLYRTGDIVSRDQSGLIHFIGRNDFQVKHQGFRIDLGEIEHIANTVLKIRNCCVIYHGETQRILMAYEADEEISIKVARHEMSGFLPKYMLPVQMVVFDKLPLNPNGKIDRSILAKEIVKALE